MAVGEQRSARQLTDRMYWLYAISSLHAGRGRGEGYIDLPLVREKVTGFPYVPGSSVKGVLADKHGASVEGRKEKPGDTEPIKEFRRLRRIAFGAADQGDGGNGNAGALVFTDARLVCLPVRSLYGTFGWCTSRVILRRLLRDLQGLGLPDLPQVPGEEPGAGATCRVPDDPASVLVQGDVVYLEDLNLGVAPCEETRNWAARIAAWVFAEDADWQIEFCKRFVVLSDDVFNFLCETGTEVQPHIRIDEDLKRASEGALWYEESLPAESVLAGLVWCDPIARNERGTILEQFCTGPIHVQIGGKATVGKGRVRCQFTSPGETS